MGSSSSARFEIAKPPNHGHRERLAALLKSFADAPSEEKREKLLHALGRAPTPREAKELAAKTLRRKRRLSNAFIESLCAKLRKLIREAKQRGLTVALLVDPIDPESLRGSPLQGTLIRTREALKNLTKYEGAFFVELRASGKMCPLCSAKGVEVAPRIYRCPLCGAEWDRDRAALVNLVRRFLEQRHLKLYKEESTDTDALRLLDSLQAWLRRHKNFLLPVPRGSGAPPSRPVPEGDPARGPSRDNEPAARRVRRLLGRDSPGGPPEP